MSRPFASALIDTYNHERFIEEAIISVLEQDFPASEMEVLVVDDGSTDRTPEIVRKFEPRVRLIRKPNGGQASAFNAGVPQSRGEIVAFLDGDDWWAQGKLTAVAEALCTNPIVGLVGHGITEIFSDGRCHTELLREEPRFRINSPQGARAFRLRKSFLGTSRMTCRKELLLRIGAIPEALQFQADEFLFTMAAVFADVLILRQSFTFYRYHQNNFFQVNAHQDDPQLLRRKQRILTTLADLLAARLANERVPEKISNIVVSSVRAEADELRLMIDSGPPWETVSAEFRTFRIHEPDASLVRWLTKALILAPALLLPSRTYYRLRQKIASNPSYAKARKRWIPTHEPRHVDRYRAVGP